MRGDAPAITLREATEDLASWLTCPCNCHVRIATMFAIAEEPRQILDNPEWVGGPQMNFIMPTRAKVFENVALKQTEVKVIASDHDDIPDTVVREYSTTETGRAARGSLEQNVKIACDAWIKDGEPGEADTKYVSQWIYDNLGAPSLPSRGAIDAGWKRWVDLGILCDPSQADSSFCATRTTASSWGWTR